MNGKNRLKESVENFFAKINRTSPLFVNAASGKLTTENLGRYLSSIHYLVSHTPKHLELARDQASKAADWELALFYHEKIEEEDNHVKWAESDIEKLKASVQLVKSFPVSPHMENLVRYLEALIEKRPDLYLAYIFLSEYFTVIAGPPWVADVEKNCGIAQQMLSIITQHVELDKDHVIEDLAAVDKLEARGITVAELISAIEPAMNHFEKFFEEVGAVTHATAKAA